MKKLLTLLILTTLLVACGHKNKPTNDENVINDNEIGAIEEEVNANEDGNNEIDFEDYDNVSFLITTPSDEAYEKFDERGIAEELHGIRSTKNQKEDIKIDKDANLSEEFPMYQAFYITKNGVTWEIQLINGNCAAYPLFYNENHEIGIILSESETVYEYHPEGDTVYTLGIDPPYEIIVVPSIDATTLENYEIPAIG